MAIEVYRTKFLQLFWGVSILIGAAGSVIFFPLKLSESHTCICHKMTCPRDACCQKGAALSSEINRDANHQAMDKMSQQHHNELINRYLVPFGLLWWGSLILLVSGICFFKKNLKMSLPQR